jgi:hypothetical protein
MGFLATLFKRDTRPVETYLDPQLGKLRWSEHDEAWIGLYNGYKFAIAYYYDSLPAEDILSYAKDMLYEPRWLRDAIVNAMKDAMRGKNARYVDEIRGLKMELIHFYKFMDEVRIFVDFSGCRSFRVWKVDFRDRVCEGMSFEGQCG